MSSVVSLGKNAVSGMKFIEFSGHADGKGDNGPAVCGALSAMAGYLAELALATGNCVISKSNGGDMNGAPSFMVEWYPGSNDKLDFTAETMLAVLWKMEHTYPDNLTLDCSLWQTEKN